LRAFFANGADKMHLPLAVEGLPVLIHLSLFLFFVGLVIFLFNVNQSVFISVTWWMGLFTVVYVGMTVMPIFRPDSPYYAPLSSTAWLLHAFLSCALYGILWFIARILFLFFLCFVCLPDVVCPSRFVSRLIDTLNNFVTCLGDQSVHYGSRMLAGEGKAVEETTLKQSSEIDLGILDWTIGALGDDETLERLFEAIPSFFSSQLVKNLKRPLPRVVRSKFVDSFRGFLSRTLTSNSVNKEVKIRRVDICMNGAMAICEPFEVADIFSNLFELSFDQVPLSNRAAEILIHWCTSNEHHFSLNLQQTVVNKFLFVRGRDDRWIGLAKNLFGMPEDVLRDNIAHGDDSVLLAILIHSTRQAIRTDPGDWDILVLPSLSKFDIHNTVPGLQNEFCALWNELVRKSRERSGSPSIQTLEEEVNALEDVRDLVMARHNIPHGLLVNVLRAIRQLYIALHHGTGAAPTAFDGSTGYRDYILGWPSSYSLCNIDTHRPHHPSRLEIRPIPGGSTAPQQTEEANITPELPSSAHHAPPAQALDIAPQVTSDTAHSIHESLQTVTLDRNQLISTEVSHFSPESLLSTTDPIPNIGHNDEPTPDIPVTQVGQISHIPTATLLTFPHPNPAPVVVTPSTTPHPPSVSVEQPGDFSDTPRRCH
jgi:hypothetical protein